MDHRALFHGLRDLVREAVATLVQPFWTLPIIGLRARDVMGYTFGVFLVLLPLVLVLGATLSYAL